MYQYYIIEVRENTDGSYAHLVHYAYDENEKLALLKGESKYHDVLSKAAVSEYARHGAVLVSSKCVPVATQYYDHTDSDPNVTALYNHQYYVIEIRQYANGEYEHEIHFAYDEIRDEARLKGESAYYTVLSAAATSRLLQHGALLISSTCVPIDFKCYERTAEELASAA